MLKPLRGYVLIEPIKDDEKTQAGVYLAETAKDKPQKGKVIATGATPVDIHKLCLEHGLVWEPGLDVGDTVIFKRWGNEEIKEGNKEFVFVKYEDIIGLYGKSD